MAARVVGAKPIVAIDLISDRLELARKLGANHCINSSTDNVSSRLSSIARSGFAFSIDTTGDDEIKRIATRALKPGGILALLAGTGDSRSHPGGRKAISVIQGDAMPQVFIPWLIHLYRGGQFPFDRLITFYDFTEINTAVANSLKGRRSSPFYALASSIIGRHAPVAFSYLPYLR